MSPSTHPLRERLQASISDSFGCAPWYDGNQAEEDLPEGVTYQSLQDEVDRYFADQLLPVIAAWLHEKAEARRQTAGSDVSAVDANRALDEAYAYDDLADSISPEATP